MKYYTRKKLTYEYINLINTLWGGNKMSRFYCRDEELRKLNKRYENTVMKKIGLDELELIREYAAVFGKGTNYHYYIFSKGGFTDGLLQAQERGEVQMLTLADIFE